MRLNKCYIENFGVLSKCEYRFEDGLNIIKQDNSYGKTTLATFIKVMFYGLDDGRKKDSERKKYLPWQGGEYGGNIEFEVDGKRYKLERFFGNKPIQDTFKLYNVSTNLESNDYTENIGEEIFKISKSAYERSTYIPQNQIQIRMEDSIRAKLSNVLENENDVNTSDEAIKRINESKKIFQKDKGAGGLIDKKNEELIKLKRIFENSHYDLETLFQKKENLEQKNIELNKVKKMREENQQLFSQKVEHDRKLAKIETYKTIIKNYNEKKERIDILNDFFKNEIPNEELIKKLEGQSYEMEKIKLEINNAKLNSEEQLNIESLKLKFENKNISEDLISKNIENYSKLYDIDGKIQKKVADRDSKRAQMNSKKRKLKLISMILLVLSLIAILIGFIFNYFIIAVGIILLVFSIIILVKCKKQSLIVKTELEDTEIEIQEMNKVKNEIKQDIENLLSSVGYFNGDMLLDLTNLKSDYKIYIELLNKEVKKQEDLQRAVSRKDMLEKSIQEGIGKYFQEFKLSYSKLLEELKLKKSEYDNLKKQFEIAKIEKGKYENENSVENLSQKEEKFFISEESLKSKIKFLNEQFDILTDEKNQMKNDIEILENRVDDNEFIDSEIENLEEEIKTLKEKYKILSKSEELLIQAKENFSSNYLQDMIIEFNKYLSIINKEDLNTSVDIELDVKLEQYGKNQNIDSFSAGYKDLIYLCMRFSLINVLFKNEKPFVVLDDPLVNLDEKKIEKSLQVIKSFSNSYQVIYFSCHSSRI